MADDQGYPYEEALYVHASQVDPNAYAPSTVPSSSVSSHESSNRLKPQHPPTSATTNIEPHSPGFEAQRPSRPVSPNLFEFINLNSTNGFDPKPARPDIIVIEDSDSQSSVESEAESDNSAPQETGRMPMHETQPEKSQRQSLIADMDYALDALPVVIKLRDRGPDLLQQTYQRMTNLTDHIYALIQALPPRNKEPVSSPSIPKGKDYYCIPCQVDKTKPMKAKTLWLTVRNFSRHMKERHYQDHEFHCPHAGCPKVFVRRHNMVDHIKTKHEQGATDTEIDSSIAWLPPPLQCSLCHRTVQNWPGFYACITRHCRDRASELSRGSTSHKPSASGGRIGKLRQSSTRVVASSSGHVAGDGPPSKKRSTHRGAPSANLHPLSGTDLQGDERAPSQEGMHLDHDEAGNPPPPSGLGFLPEFPSRELGSNSSGLNSWHCTRCEHLFSGCVECFEKTENGTFCHACPLPPVIGQVADQAGGTVLGYPDYPAPPLRQNMFFQTHLDTFDQNAFLGSYLGPEQDSETQYRSSWGAPGNQMPFIRQRSDYQVGAMVHAPLPVPDVDLVSLSKPKVAEPAEACIRRLLMKQPVTGRLDLLLQEFSLLTISDKISTLPRDISFTAVSSPPTSGCRLSSRTAAKLEENCSGHAIVSLAPGKKLEMDLRILAPEDRGRSHPLRTRVQIVVKLLKLRSSAARDKSKRDAAKLAFEQALKSAFDCVPNEQLHSDADDSEDSDGASVVFDEAATSMLSSCSDISVISPFQSCFPKYLGVASISDDDATSVSSFCSDSSARPTLRPSSPDNLDVDSVIDEGAVSMQSPCSDLSEEPNASFETTEVSFDLDLESSLHRMSRLSGGLADGVCSDPASIEAAQVLEYFFNYVLYMMTTMSRSVDDNSGPHSDE